MFFYLGKPLRMEYSRNLELLTKLLEHVDISSVSIGFREQALLLPALSFYPGTIKLSQLPV